MNLQSQVTSLKLSKKLKKLEVEQESLWHWKEFKNGRTSLRHATGFLPSKNSLDNYYSAFTVAELGGALPELLIDKYGQEQWLDIRHHRGWDKDKKWARKDKWEIFYQNIFSTNYQGEKQSLVEAMAKMLIYLLENKLIELKGDTDEGFHPVRGHI